MASSRGTPWLLTADICGAWARRRQQAVQGVARDPGQDCHGARARRRYLRDAGLLVRALGLALALGMGLASSGHAQPVSEVASGWNDRAPVRAQHWMVAAANPLAVEAASAMLAKGGSAVDAAIAAQLVLGLVEPQSSGLGGGAFMLVHDARTGALTAYDGRETAPAAARPDRFLGPGGTPLAFHQAVVGGLSVGVPGVPRLLALAHRQHGKLRWAELFAPAIALAERGFAVSPRLHTLIASERYFVQPRIRAYFLDANGAPLAVGHRLRNPAYAATLRTLAREGADAFYRGDRLPPEYRSRQYVVDDWRGHRLSAPPRGYQWVQSGGDYLLVAIASGVIASIVPNH